MKKGFTLVETLVAVAILTAIVAAVTACLSAVIKSNTVNDQLTTAESIARSQLEYIQDQQYDAVSDPVYPVSQAISVPPGYSVIPVAICVDASGNATSSDDGLQKITVTVTYSGKSLFTLTDYKVDR